MNLQLDGVRPAGTAPDCHHLDDERLDDARTPHVGPISVPLARWRTEREALLARSATSGQRIGVRLYGDDAVADIVEDLMRLDLVVVVFPQFTDGRGYSLARQLRQRYGFRGELRAAGDIQRDQLNFLARCGFDVLELSAELDENTAAAALNEISVRYQPDDQTAGFPLAIGGG